MNAARSVFQWTLRFIRLSVLFIVTFVIGSLAVVRVVPDMAMSEPGLVPPTSGLLVIALANVFVITALILASRWSGWKLAWSLALAYYGAVTLLTQIEAWYFLSSTSSPARRLRAIGRIPSVCMSLEVGASEASM